eukprot:3159779-Ditylum_brightwellii.AAC.1
MMQQARVNNQIESRTHSSLTQCIATLPAHEQRMLGNLKTDNTDPEDWLNMHNRNKVTIATDGLVAKEKELFAVVLYTNNRKINAKNIVMLQTDLSCHTRPIWQEHWQLFSSLRH